MILDSLIAFTLLLGSSIILLSAVGILRLPDAICRGHALGKGMTLGLILVLVGLWIYLGLETAGIKLPLAVLFQFLTIPIASHLLVRLAYQQSPQEDHPPRKTDKPLNPDL
ncbi:MAG TPA: monovalent cation/H(+) antiporter subunit G [Oceanipulchritudo sp.]|nr:monovalent cation/H(+) antiporter subunit G [Oceanipulchritudo sp.]